MPFCTHCGGAISKGQRYCADCGAALHALGPSEPNASDHSVREAAVTEPRVVLPTATRHSSSVIAAAPREVHLSGSGSTLFVDREPLDAPESTERGIPPAAVMAGILLALVLSGVGGYWWFRAQRSPSGSVAVESTEQALEPPDQRDREPSSADHRAPRPTGEMAANAATTGEPAWSLIAESTREVTNGAEALGRPDQKAAIIAPGGSLAIGYGMDTYFYNGPGADVELHGPEGERTPYTIFARESAADRWVRFDVNRRGFLKGLAAHDMGHHGMERARQILITNAGEADLRVDAVTSRYNRPASHEEHESGGPAHLPRR